MQPFALQSSSCQLLMSSPLHIYTKGLCRGWNSCTKPNLTTCRTPLSYSQVDDHPTLIGYC